MAAAPVPASPKVMPTVSVAPSTPSAAAHAAIAPATPSATTAAATTTAAGAATPDSKSSSAAAKYESEYNKLAAGGASLSIMKGLGPVCNLYGLENYTFGEKEPMHEKENTPKARFDRMEAEFSSIGMRRTVEAILLVHNHGHPHILLLQVGNSLFKLPGGRLKPGENEVDGLKRKLTRKLAANMKDIQPEWEVSELVGCWWRPQFDALMYPYIPPHVTKPKESRKTYLVLLPEKCYFAVPRNLKLLAVPLFELFDNPQRYGPVISSIPTQLSRFSFNAI